MKRHGATRGLCLSISESVAHTGAQDGNLHRSGVQIRPSQSDHFRPPESSATGKQDHCPVAHGKLFGKALELIGGENILVP